MPALEMAQETGKILKWIKPEGAIVAKGEPIMEIETDKVTVEIEAPASGILGGVTGHVGDAVPVGQTIAWILAPGEQAPLSAGPAQSGRTGVAAGGRAQPAPAMQMDQSPPVARPNGAAARATEADAHSSGIVASPVALQIAREHGIDLALVRPSGGRIDKADVLAYLTGLAPIPLPPDSASFDAAERRSVDALSLSPDHRIADQEKGRGWSAGPGDEVQRVRASPKARRLAAERGVDIAALRGSGPDGAVIAADVPVAAPSLGSAPAGSAESEGVSTIWRVMAERMTASWTTVPHFYLTREIGAARLVEMRSQISPVIEKRVRVKPTITDLLVKLTAAVLRDHPRLNASVAAGGFRPNDEIHIGLAIAVEDGLIVPVIHNADRLSVGEIAAQRQDLQARAKAGKLRPADISGGTFTLTNLGMYNVDAFNPIVNSPQAAILAVGRIAERVVPVDGQPAVRPTMILTLACDHRVVDGARGARFLDDLANLIQEPWGLLA